MKKVCAMLSLVLLTSASFAHATDLVVDWGSIVGVITAPNVNNPVGTINSGTFPWSTRSGRAGVNLSTGAAFFAVEGLVINGGAALSGTPGPVTQVIGTLVCNSGDPTPTILDTPAVRLDKQGDAFFSGRIDGIPASCVNPLFLVRIATPAGAAGLWIATGAERSVG